MVYPFESDANRFKEVFICINVYVEENLIINKLTILIKVDVKLIENLKVEKVIKRLLTSSFTIDTLG